MPTYARRTGFTDAVQENGVYYSPDNATLATYAILTETVLTFADTEDFAVRETVTETDSTETGVVYWKTATEIGLIDVSGAFVGGKTITGGTSGEILTPTAVSNRFEKTAATPVSTPLVTAHALTSTGAADDQTVYLDRSTTLVKVWNVTGATVTVCNGATTVILNVIPAGKAWTFPVNGKAAKLILQFSAAGSCRLDEYNVGAMAQILLE